MSERESESENVTEVRLSFTESCASLSKLKHVTDDETSFNVNEETQINKPKPEVTTELHVAASTCHKGKYVGNDNTKQGYNDTYQSPNKLRTTQSQGAAYRRTQEILQLGTAENNNSSRQTPRGGGTGKRRRNRGPNNNQRPQAQPREKNIPSSISAPIKINLNVRPTPKSLATQSSELNNDPMWQDFEMEGRLCRLIAIKRNQAEETYAEGKFQDFMRNTAPVVIAQRIQQDLAYTIDQEMPRIWNLRPAEANAGLPTANLLGWALATTLTPEQ
ncbi:hypothetical protein C0J52_19817 [Blattella germanica]|nr:hypothetical protein C0J52_19817 [Blattella germanica]